MGSSAMTGVLSQPGRLGGTATLRPGGAAGTSSHAGGAAQWSRESRAEAFRKM